MNKIHQVNLSNIPALQELYQHTALTVDREDYTAEEVADWTSCGDDTSCWDELFEEQHYMVAEDEEGMIIGFGSVNGDGYVRTLSVHRDFQHQGVTTSLYEHLEAYARERGVKRLTSEVSVTAKPFLGKQGFQIDEE